LQYRQYRYAVNNEKHMHI